MLFRVDPAPCSSSVIRRCQLGDSDPCTCVRNVTLTEDEWNDEKFKCTDFNGGPQPTTSGNFWVVATPQKDTDTIYFDGPISIPSSRLFNATAPEDEEEFSDNMALNLYTADPDLGGILLQEVRIRSSCSEDLFLLDVIGSFQLLEFEGIEQGLVAFGVRPSVAFDITVNTDPDVPRQLRLDYLSIVAISSQPDVLPPQLIDVNVTNVVIPPPFTISEEITLIPGEPMNIITTVAGTFLDNIGCFDVSNTTIQCDATVPKNSKKGSKKGKASKKGGTKAPKKGKKGKGSTKAPGKGKGNSTKAPTAGKGAKVDEMNVATASTSSPSTGRRRFLL